KEYVHRSGRTARAGAAGSVVTLALPHQLRSTRRILGEAEVEARWAEEVTSAAHPSLAELGGRAPSGEPAGDPAAVKYKGAPRKLDLSRSRGADGRKAQERRTNEERRASWDPEPERKGRRGGQGRARSGGGRSGTGQAGTGRGRGRGRSGAPSRAPRRRGGRCEDGAPLADERTAHRSTRSGRETAARRGAGPPRRHVMSVSTFDLFKIGIGPSSSHTVGPMRAAARFARDVLDDPETGARVADVSVHRYGSLAATAAGHGTLGAVVMGLEGEDPESVDPVAGLARVARIEEKGGLRLDGRLPIGLRPSSIVLHPLTFLPQHSNGMTFIALDADGEELRRRAMFSVGGGFVVDEDDMDRSIAEVAAEGEGRAVFTTGDELLRVCEDRGIP